MDTYIKGRGSQLNPGNKFEKISRDIYLDDLGTDEEREELLTTNPKTKYIDVFPKTIVNKVESPDVGPAWSMNPYQGCEHGCIYCYARNSHQYWGYNAGLEFEQNILVKRNAPELLEEFLNHPKWEPESIMLSGNTDCFQPVERKLGITRKILEVFLRMKHPVGIITKNSLIERDIDILKALAADRLVHVTLSLTTLDEKLKRVMEPRTSSANSVLRTLSKLSDAGIPVNINIAPIIPAINDEGIFELMKTIADHGASSAMHTVVRLNGHNSVLFEDWVKKNFPDRANKVLNQIRTMHNGQLNDSQFGRRMRGEGKFAELIKNQMILARKKYMDGRVIPSYNYDLFTKKGDSQLKLF